MVQILENGQWIDFGDEIIPYDYTRTLDETLDSAKIILYNEISTPLAPSTLLKLDDEVWYVNTDKTLQKSGGKIQHTIQLDELTQLLNDRYLGNVCNSPNTYSLGECIERLLTIANSNDIKVNYGEQEDKQEEFDLNKLNTSVGWITGSGSYAMSHGISEEKDYSVYEFPNYSLLLSDFHLYFSGTVAYKVDGEGYDNIYLDFNDIEITKDRYSIGGLTFEFYLKDNKLHFGFRRTPVSSNTSSTLYYICMGVDIHSMYFTYKTYKIDIMQMSKLFQFEDTNLFNSLSQVCKSINMFPRLKYNDGLELNFEYIGINYDHETSFSEIEDIEVIKELSRNSNANVVVSNAKNLCGNDYVWYPNSEYGKQLIPVNQGTSLKQDDIGIFYCNSNIKNVRSIKVFPQISVYRSIINTGGVFDSEELVFKTYYDESFGDRLKDELVKSMWVAEETASKVSQLYMSKCSPGYVNIGEDGQGSYRFYKNTLELIAQGEILFYAKEKKQYDLLSHDYLFDKFKIDKVEETIYWEQGKNYIRGFDKHLYNNNKNYVFYDFGIRIDYDFSKARVKLAVEYQPMIDTKVVKRNNSNNGITRQYNQSDKMIDLDSYNSDLTNYINNMESKDVIVNAYYENKDDILKPGYLMYDDTNDIKYVITNVSVTYFGNNNYDVIYQLNEEHIRRSEYISANSDIRDYNIPQTNTIKRTSTYMDDIEIDYNSGSKNGYASYQIVENNFFKQALSENGFAINSNSLIGIFRATYQDETSSYFTCNPVQLRSAENNSIIYSINIDDNAIIDWNKYNGGYTASGVIENIFSLDLNNLYSLKNDALVYHPIRYTDVNGRIRDLQLYLYSEGEIRLYDYNNGTNRLRLLYENYPNLTENFFITNISSVCKEYVSVTAPRFLKDKYETVCWNYQVNYTGVNGIELFNYINNKIQSNCVVRLYDKSKYKYINRKTLLGEDYIETTISNNSLSGGTIKFDIDTEENLQDYIIMVCTRNGENIMCLNNHPFDTNHIKLNINFKRKY